MRWLIPSCISAGGAGGSRLPPFHDPLGEALQRLLRSASRRRSGRPRSRRRPGRPSPEQFDVGAAALAPLAGCGCRARRRRCPSGATIGTESIEVSSSPRSAGMYVRAVGGLVVGDDDGLPRSATHPETPSPIASSIFPTRPSNGGVARCSRSLRPSLVHQADEAHVGGSWPRSRGVATPCSIRRGPGPLRRRR